MWGLGELLLPRRCVGCNAPGHTMCAACLREWRSPPGRISTRSFAHWPLWALGPMSEVRSRTVVHYKERGRADAAQYLGAITQAAVSRLIEQGHVSGQVVLVPAPSKRSSARARGGDHMARALAHCSFPYVQALYHSEQALESVGLSAQARRQNMQQAVRLAPEAALLRGREVLLVDDVITTGATLIAAASALSSAGAKVAGGLGWISA